MTRSGGKDGGIQGDAGIDSRALWLSDLVQICVDLEKHHCCLGATVPGMCIEVKLLG